MKGFPSPLFFFLIIKGKWLATQPHTNRPKRALPSISVMKLLVLMSKTLFLFFQFDPFEIVDCCGIKCVCVDVGYHRSTWVVNVSWGFYVRCPLCVCSILLHFHFRVCVCVWQQTRSIFSLRRVGVVSYNFAARARTVRCTFCGYPPAPCNASFMHSVTRSSQ